MKRLAPRLPPPPRHHGHEDAVARARLLGGGTKDAGLVGRARNELRERFGGATSRNQVV